MTTTIFKEKKLSQDKEIKRKIGVILSKIYREITIKGRPVKDVRINLLINEMRQEEAVGGRLGRGLTHVGEALWFGIYDGHRLHTDEDVAKVFDALYDYNKACMVRQSDKKKAMEKQTTIEAYPLTLDEYQEGAMSTCMESSANYVYMAEGMVGEMGEFTSKVAKAIRKGEARIDGNQLHWTDELGAGLKAELGDIMWFVAGLARAFGWTLNEVAAANLEKLAARKKAGTINGNGDGIKEGEGRTRA